MLGVIDTYGIELIHPMREGRSPQQIGRKGLSNHRWIVGGKLCPLNLSLRHEVAKLIVWHVVTRPVVPSTVSYADVREGNAPYRACGHGTHSH